MQAPTLKPGCQGVSKEFMPAKSLRMFADAGVSLLTRRDLRPGFKRALFVKGFFSNFNKPSLNSGTRSQ